MLRLGRMTDYGVVVLAHLARHRPRVLTTPAIAEGTGLPSTTVAKLLKGLSRDHGVGSLVVARRGAAGGYVLERAPEQITVADMIAALEGRRRLVDCVDRGDGHATGCAMERVCPMHGRWDPVNAAVAAALDSVTLADMMSAEWQPRPLPVRAPALAAPVAAP